MSVALITGVNGQDGMHLAAYLTEIGYAVVGMLRLGTGASERALLTTMVDGIEIVAGDLTDFGSLHRIIRDVAPDEIYNLAAISSVRLSWAHPTMTGEINALGLVNLLEAVRATARREIRVFQASSVQMFGEVEGEVFHEKTPIRPTSPYGASKAFAHFIANSYRRQHDIFVACGILGNHSSPLQGDDHVLGRIAGSVAQLAVGKRDTVTVDNLSGTRDWGYAGDYVEAMHAILQQSAPDDFVIATGEVHSVADALAVAMSAAGIRDWQSAIDVSGGEASQVTAGVPGDITKARGVLRWSPRLSFADLVTMMVKYRVQYGEAPVPGRAWLSEMRDGC
jgi:GDPmannose 4,6-dehydratase